MDPHQHRSGAGALAAVLLFASGFAALAYQILWVQQASLWLGQESAAVLAVVAAFFAGLALGALAAGRYVERAARPARLYTLCEILVAAWAFVLLLLLQPFAGWLARLIGPDATPLQQWSVAFGGTLLMLLPGTVAMGATLPAVERALRAGGDTQAFGPLYAANTGGAMLGVLTAAFWMVPHWGLARTALCCGAINLVCALAALALPTPPGASPPPEPATRQPQRLLPGLLFATGLLGIGFELTVVRALSQLSQNTVYTFSMLLAVYLAGTTLGAALLRPIAARCEPARLRTALLCGLALASASALPLLATASRLQAWLADVLPAGVTGALAAEAWLAMLLFLPATILMGVTFAHLVTQAQRGGIVPGRALAVNTLGGALAAPLLSLMLLPWWGLRGVLLAIPAGYLLLSARSRWTWAGAFALAALAWWLPRLELTTIPVGGQLLAQREGRMAAVAVVEDAAGTRTLHIDNRQQEGSNRSTYADARQALLPLLLHPSPQRALFLGVGTGVTASAATLDPGLQVDAVELVPEVLDTLPWFAEAMPRDADPARLQLIAADARRYVRAAGAAYDVVVADNFHPARSGTGALYSREHFLHVRQRLAPGGLFCQWLPLHQLDMESLASIVHSYMDVFPDAVAILATNSLDTPTLGLVARVDAAPPTVAEVARRLAQLPPSAVGAFAVEDLFAVLGSVVGGPDSLRSFGDTAPANTDDRPVVAYRAPFETYAPTALPRDRLLAVVDAWQARPADVIAVDSAPAGVTARLQRYWAARNRYLHAGRDVRPVADLRGMLEQVREPLLAVLRMSPDFRPAWEPLLGMANALAQEDPAAGEALLAEMSALRPSAGAAGGP